MSRRQLPMPKPGHHHQVLPRPHQVMARSTHHQRHRHQDHSLAEAPPPSARPRQPPLPDPIPRLHRPRDPGRPHRQHRGRRRQARPRQLPSRVSTVQRTQSATGVRSSATTPTTAIRGWGLPPSRGPGQRSQRTDKLEMYGTPNFRASQQTCRAICGYAATANVFTRCRWCRMTPGRPCTAGAADSG